MKTAGLLALVLSILLTGGAQEPTVDKAGYPEVQYGAQAYKDLHSGIILYVESDARHVCAISRTGKLLWTREPFKDAHLEIYRTKHPQIAQLGRGLRPSGSKETRVTSSTSTLILLSLGCSELPTANSSSEAKTRTFWS